MRKTSEITIELYMRIRQEKGLVAYVPNGNYESERLAQIAKRQDELLKEMANLDYEVSEMLKQKMERA